MSNILPSLIPYLLFGEMNRPTPMSLRMVGGVRGGVVSSLRLLGGVRGGEASDRRRDRGGVPSDSRR